MLIIKGPFKSVAINWDCVESLHFDNSEAPDFQLKVITKSGCAITALNPTGENGEPVDFNTATRAWVDNYTCWSVTENNSTRAPKIAKKYQQQGYR